MKRILIIEDDEMIAGIYKRKFENAGYAVDLETDGSQGYYRIYKMLPDAVLLDLLLPGMDGPAIIRKFRAQKKFSQLPIIVFTNAYLTEMGREAVNAGATKVFNKSTVTPQEILAAVESSLSGQVESQEASHSVPQGTKNDDSAVPADFSIESSFHAESPYEQKEGTDKGTAAANVSPERSDQSTKPQPFALPVDQPQQTTATIQSPNESALQSAVLLSFIEKSGVRINALQQALRSLQAEGKRTPKVDSFIDIARVAHTIGSNAAIVGLHYLAHIASALEALAWELFDDPSQFAVPTRQTLAKAIDMIAKLIQLGIDCESKEFSRFIALVVDDDAIARKMITKTLDRASLSYVGTGRPELAMELLSENEFDLVILDVQMDGISGFDFCSEMRKMPQHGQTRVIFVSSLTDFQSKLQSAQVGGNEFIVKPFAPMELGLKVLLHMISSQIDRKESSEQETEK